MLLAFSVIPESPEWLYWTNHMMWLFLFNTRVISLWNKDFKRVTRPFFPNIITECENKSVPCLMLPSKGRGFTRHRLAEPCKLSHDMREVLIHRHHLHVLAEPILCPLLAFPQKCCHSSESKTGTCVKIRHISYPESSQRFWLANKNFYGKNDWTSEIKGVPWKPVGTLTI